MQITIPGGTTLEALGNTWVPLCEWLATNGVHPVKVKGTEPIIITDDAIHATWLSSGEGFKAQVTMPMTPELEYALTVAGFQPPEVALTDADSEAAPLDDMAHLVKQLEEGRALEKAGKEKADEAKVQILARLREANREYGTVNGQRVLHAKTITKSQFRTVAFRNAHPDLCKQFTTEREETRLEIL